MSNKVVVKPKYEQEFAEPVHIYLDKLFEKPGDEPDTRAYLRLNLEVAEGKEIPDGRQVMIRLFETPDFQVEPAKEMSMASESLLVSGRVGKAEFISGSLPIGKYFLQVFVDADGNGYLDEAELSAQFEKYGELALIDVAANRTETVALTLTDGVSEEPQDEDQPDDQ